MLRLTARVLQGVARQGGVIINLFYLIHLSTHKIKIFTLVCSLSNIHPLQGDSLSFHSPGSPSSLFLGDTYFPVRLGPFKLGALHTAFSDMKIQWHCVPSDSALPTVFPREANDILQVWTQLLEGVLFGQGS